MGEEQMASMADRAASTSELRSLRGELERRRSIGSDLAGLLTAVLHDPEVKVSPKVRTLIVERVDEWGQVPRCA